MKLRAVAPALLLAWNFTAVADDGDGAAVAPPAQPPVSAAARVSSVLPKYSPAVASTPAPAGDRRELDRPRNAILRLPSHLLPPDPAATAPASAAADEPPPDGVVRLPRYEVQDERLPPFKERELLTPAARIELGFKRHPGLRIGNLFGLNGFIALAMTEAEFAAERQREMADLYAFAAFADSLPKPPTDAKTDTDSGSTGSTPAVAPAK